MNGKKPSERRGLMTSEAIADQGPFIPIKLTMGFATNTTDRQRRQPPDTDAMIPLI